MLALVQKLYVVERHCREGDFSNEKRLEERQARAVPVLEQIKELLEHYNLVLTPQNPLAQAVAYSLKRWEKLILYALNGMLEIDMLTVLPARNVNDIDDLMPSEWAKKKETRRTEG